MTGPGRADPAQTVGGAWELSAEGTACWHAERALLGALLRRPERLAEMSSWLGGHDFADPVHRGVFATIQALSTAGAFRPVAAETGALAELDPAAREAIAHNVLAVRNALADQRHTDLPAGSDRDLVRGLYDAGASAVASQYARYARMVVEMSVRRQIEAWGVRLELAASSEATADGDLAALQTTREAMMDNLADLTIQLRQSDGELTHRLDRNPVGAPAIPPTTAPVRKLVERAELQVIHAVIADPQWRESGILQRLRPDDFLTSRAHANTWRAIQAVSARGEPIDPVTVAWEAELLATDLRHGVGAQDRVGLSATELSSMTSVPGGDVRRAISTVARSSLAEHARQTRHEVQESAADRRRGPQAAIAAARDAGAELEQHASRLTGARKPRSRLAQTLDGERSPASAPVPTTAPARTR